MVRSATRAPRRRFPVTTSRQGVFDGQSLSRARAQFGPVQEFLDRVERVITTQFDSRCKSERHEMHQTAQSTFEVGFRTGDKEGALLSFPFLVTGQNADTLLLQCGESRDLDSGKFDQ